MTLTATSTLIMSHSFRRWLTKKEILTLQGLPVSTKLTPGSVPTNSFDLRAWQKEHNLPYAAWPGRQTTISQAGNAMHVSCAGAMLLFAISQTIMDVGMLRLQRSWLKRQLALCVEYTMGNAGNAEDSNEASSETRSRRRLC